MCIYSLPGSVSSTMANAGGPSALARAAQDAINRTRSEIRDLEQGLNADRRDVKSTAAAMAANPDTKVFVDFLRQSKVDVDSCATLVANGVDSFEAFLSLMPQDLDSLRMSLGQTRLLQRIAHGELTERMVTGAGPAGQQCVVSNVGPQLHEQVPRSSTPAQLPGPARLPGPPQMAFDASFGPGLAQSEVVDKGELDIDMFLGIGMSGKQEPYLDVTDFVKRRSLVDAGDKQHVEFVTNEDGFMRLDMSGGKKVSLKDVSVFQWTEANTQIMARLVASGVPAKDYMAYTVHISQLAQKYQWWSVLLYDRDYRQMQANKKFRWGTDFPALRDVNLVPKERKQGGVGQGRKRNDQRNVGNKASGDQSFRAGQKFSGNRPKADGDSRAPIVCRDFNFRVCDRKNCKYLHVCNKCRSSEHGEKNHSN